MNYFLNCLYLFPLSSQLFQVTFQILFHFYSEFFVKSFQFFDTLPYELKISLQLNPFHFLEIFQNLIEVKHKKIFYYNFLHLYLKTLSFRFLQ